MKTLYLECKSGISGDMTVATLLDLGADREKLEEIINDMNLGCKLHFGHTEKNSIYAYDFDVEIQDESKENQRSIKEIFPIIDASKLPMPVKFKAKEIFEIVAKAESKVHKIPVDEVHFHEVGAVDSIVDICAAAFCLYDLGIEKVIVSPLYEGTGTIKCQHGYIPVPTPATSEICRERDIPLSILDGVNSEMVTPTGAAIAASFADSFGVPKDMHVIKIGYGAGKKNFKHANILRGFLFEDGLNDSKDATSDGKDATSDSIIVLETNVDDSTAEELGYCLEKLFEIGVRDAFFTPIYMKKCRPAYSLTVMCKEEQEESAVKLIFKHTSSVGLRRTVKDRIIMAREKISVNTAYGEVDANKFTYDDIEKISLEYNSVKALADEKGIAVNKIYRNY